MKYLYLNKYWDLDKEYNIDKLLYLMTDRPNEMNKYKLGWTNIINNNIVYYRNYDLPAYVECHNKKLYVNLHWFINNKQHREKSKPAYINGHDGLKAYFINNNFIKREYSK